MSDDPKNPREPGDELPKRPPKRRAEQPADSEAGAPSAPDAQWRRPDRDGQAEDRFPMLPDEAPPPTAPLKDPPRPRPAPKRSGGSNDLGRNLIALFFLLASCGAVSYFAVIWQNPYSALNPLAPPTPLPQIITATYTPSATLTPSPTLTPTLTRTPTEIPSATATVTFTPIFLEGFSTPQGTPPPTEDTTVYQFSSRYEKSPYVTNPAARGGCNWSSIAGSVMNYDGSALNGYGVHVVGDGVDQTVATGSATGFGPGGFEVPLGNAAKDAQYVAQLIDPQGNAVSPLYTVTTLSDCEKNIAKLIFVENLPSS